MEGSWRVADQFLHIRFYCFVQCVRSTLSYSFLHSDDFTCLKFLLLVKTLHWWPLQTQFFQLCFHCFFSFFSNSSSWGWRVGARGISPDTIVPLCSKVSCHVNPEVDLILFFHVSYSLGGVNLVTHSWSWHSLEIININIYVNTYIHTYKQCFHCLFIWHGKHTKI